MGSVNWRGFWIGLIVALVALSISVNTFERASNAGGGYVILWGAVLWGAWKALTSLGGAGKPKPIELSQYGMDSLRNLLRSFITEWRREPTNREQRYLAQVAAFMQHSHDFPLKDLSTPESIQEFSQRRDVWVALAEGLYGRDLSNDEQTAFSIMLANAYPKNASGTKAQTAAARKPSRKQQASA